MAADNPQIRAILEDEESDFNLEEHDEKYWEDAYRTYRSDADEADKPEAQLEFDERRAHPRLSFPADSTIFVHSGPLEYPIVNISVGGIAFHSQKPFEIGNRITLSALGMLALDVDVLSCTMEEADSPFMDFHYVVRGRFAETVNGYQAFILAREIYKRLRDSNS